MCCAPTLHEAYKETGQVHPTPAHMSVDKTGPAAAEVATKAFPMVAPQILDEFGNVVDNATKLKELKLEVGVYVYTLDKDGGKRYAVIQSMDHERVALWSPDKTKSPKARTFTLPSAEVVEKWKPVVDASEVADHGLILNWQLLGPDCCVELLANNTKNLYANMLLRVWTHFEAAQGVRPIRIATRPRKKVFATVAMEPSTLSLVPFSPSLAFQKPSPETASLDLKIISPVKGDETLHVKPYFTCPTPAKPNSGGLVPFWAVERLNSAKALDPSVNCRLDMYRVSGAFVFPEKFGMTASHDQSKVEIPVLTNFKAVAEGEPLVWCDESWVVVEKKSGGVVKASKRLMCDALDDGNSRPKKAALDEH